MAPAMKRSLIFLLLFLVACTTAAPPPAEPVQVLIVATTDVHGWFNGHTETIQGTTQQIHYGGLAILKSYVDALRASNGDRVLLVDAGDMFQGTLESNLFEGESVIRGYNLLGYDAAAVGNHEFDFGPAGPDPVARNPGDDPLGALKRNAALARFPLLSANMTEKAGGATPSWAKRSVIVERAGAKIGIIGLSTPDTPNVTLAANVVTLNFGDPVAATVREARALRAQGADAVIVVAHMGGRCRSVEDPHDISSCETKQEVVDFLAALPAGTIDAYLGGHTHAYMRHFLNDVPTSQAGSSAREFATIELWIDPRANRVLRDRTVLRPHTMLCTAVFTGTERCDARQAPPGATLTPRVFEGKAMTADAEMTALFAPYLARVAAKREERLGIRTADRFVRAYQKESALGNLLADALREGTRADIAMFNSGGIRAELREGDLVYGDIFEVSPFDNYPAVATLTGAQILEILRLTTRGDRGVMQVSGIRYTYDARKDADKPVPERNRFVSATLADGSPIDPDRLYRVAMPDFVATGGDGTAPVMKNVPPERLTIDSTRAIREMLIDDLKARPQPLTPKLEGRITVLNDE